MSKSQRSSKILSHSPKSIADPSLLKRIPTKNLTSPSELLVHRPSLTSLRKNKQFNLPTITVHNLDKSPVKVGIFAQFDETKTAQTMGFISPIVHNLSSFMNSNSPETNLRGSRLKTLNICFSPVQDIASPNRRLNQSIDTPYKDDVPHYQAMTLSGVHHITGKVKKENSRKFIFSKPKDSPLLVNLDPLGSHQPTRRSSDSRSQESPDSSGSQKALFAVLGKPLDYTKKKSTFFTKKSFENNDKNEISPLPRLLKPQPVLQVKQKIGPLYILQKKRVSSILTKELEARYGIQFRSPDVSQDEIEIIKSPVKSIGLDSQKAQYDSPGEKLLEASTQATILLSSGLKGSTVKSPTEEGALNFEDLRKRFETKEVESSGNFPAGPKCSKRRESKSISGYGSMFKEKDVFGDVKGTYFQINKSNKYVKKMNQTMTYFGAKSEPFLDDIIDAQDPKNRKEITEPVYPQTERAARNQAMITQIGKMNLNQIVQPQFMERNGTMCVTEFWSHKKKKSYTKIMEGQVKHVTILDEKRKDEFLYKPKRWKEEEFVQAQMKKNAVEGGRQVELAREEAKIRDKLRKHPVPAENPPVVINLGAKHFRKERSEPYLVKPLVKLPSTQNLRMLTEYVGKESTEEKRELAKIKEKKKFDERFQKTLESFKFRNNKIQKNMEEIFQK